MLDVVLLAEILWCVLWYRSVGIHKSLLYSGGFVAAGYVSLQVSEWFTNTFLPPTNPVFTWVEGHLATDSQTRSVLSRYLPPQPAAVDLGHSHWLAYYVIQGIMVVAMTAAVFSAFLIVGYLVDALWDRPPASLHRSATLWSLVLGLASGSYGALLTSQLVVYLAWIRNLHGLAVLLRSSAIIHWLP